MDAEREQAEERWSTMYWLWVVYHQRLMGMDGPQGKISSGQLFADWEPMLCELAPTIDELESATRVVVGEVETFDRPWTAHYALVRRAILTARRAREAAERHDEQRRRIAEPVQKTSLVFAQALKIWRPK